MPGAAQIVAWLARPQIEHVHVGAGPRVVSQVPAVVVRIVVNHHVVALPVPVARVVDVEGRDLKSGAFKPESLGISAFNPKHVARTEPEREASRRPGTIEV